MTNVELHPSAEEELLDATNWYLQKSSLAARGFVREIDRAFARIAEAPYRYALTILVCRRFVLLNCPYDIVYRVSSTAAEVIAVAHHSRRPGYWHNR